MNSINEQKEQPQKEQPYKEPLRFRLYLPFWKFFRWGRHLLGFHNKYCKKAGEWELSPHKQTKGPHCDVTGIEFK